MARGVNKTILIGNVGADPEYRVTPSGDGVVNFTLATSESWKDKQTQEIQQRTEWHKLTAFKEKAIVIRDHVKKGSKIYIEGSLRTRKWQSQSGEDHYTTEIIVQNFEFLGNVSHETGQPDLKDDDIPT